MRMAGFIPSAILAKSTAECKPMLVLTFCNAAPAVWALCTGRAMRHWRYVSLKVVDKRSSPQMGVYFQALEGETHGFEEI
jgi:hypothetical protein